MDCRTRISSIKEVKASREMGARYMTFEEYVKEEREEARAEGRAEGQTVNFIALLRKKYPDIRYHMRLNNILIELF